MSEATRFKARFNDITWYRRNVPCMEACPVHTDSGRYVQLIAEGRAPPTRSPPFAVACAPPRARTPDTGVGSISP